MGPVLRAADECSRIKRIWMKISSIAQIMSLQVLGVLLIVPAHKIIDFRTRKDA